MFRVGDTRSMTLHLDELHFGDTKSTTELLSSVIVFADVKSITGRLSLLNDDDLADISSKLNES